MSTSKPPTKLIAHFQDRKSEPQTTGWSELWDNDQSDLWDRGFPSPALIDFLEQGSSHIPKPAPGKRLRALVPGCGKGYDVVMLALHGFDAYGLEASQTAVSTASNYSKTELADPSSHHFNMDRGAKSTGIGTVQFVFGDFFAQDWEKQCVIGNCSSADPEECKFDLIYDYTFLCALPPRLRRPWAKRISSLLSPTGILICLEFPLYKPLAAEGPPWGLQGVYHDLLVQGGDGLLGQSDSKDHHENEGGDANDDDILSPSTQGGIPKGAFTEVLRYKPERTYAVGKDSDMLSVWKMRERA